MPEESGTYHAKLSKLYGESSSGSTREWFPGYKGKTAKGDFTIIRKTSTGWLAHYTSGEWKDKFIDMPKTAGKPATRIESLRMSKEDKDQFLDLFYNDYPQEYLSMHGYLERVHPDSLPNAEEVLHLLKEDYPPLFQLTLNKFLQDKK